jgi:starch synthase
MKILFLISEVEGFTKTGGLADVGKSLPIALRALGHDVRVVKPYYKEVADKNPNAKPIASSALNTTKHVFDFDIYRFSQHNLPVYCIDYPDFFSRDGLYSNDYEAFADNGERFSFFSQASLQLAKAIEFKPDIIHCNDWHTALACYFLKQDESAFYAQTRSLLTIHNGAFQGIYPYHQVPSSHHCPSLIHQLDEHGNLNFLKLGIEHADKINAVSPNYGEELKTPLGSHHLYASFKKREADISGILNGCDYQQWDPSTDSLLPFNYTMDNMAGKSSCKKALQKTMSLPIRKKVPIIGMVCRLTAQKGFDYITPILSSLLEHNIQLIIIGSGDPAIAASLASAMKSHPTKMAFYQGFSNELAHLLEAGSDFFLMPSLFEPCGLNQMYSLAYGTIPIVRAVGGLKDTVIDPSNNIDTATGFVFDEPSNISLINCLRRALLFYREYPEAFDQMRQRAMQTRFTWENASEHYQSLYKQAKK